MKSSLLLAFACRSQSKCLIMTHKLSWFGFSLALELHLLPLNHQYFSHMKQLVFPKPVATLALAQILLLWALSVHSILV